MENRGCFIAVEGPNYSGKTTFIGILSAFWRGCRVPVLATREPGGTPFGEGLRSVLKNPQMKGGTFATALAFEGARQEHCERVIKPAVARGEVVICDRYYPSTDIFQGVLANDVTQPQQLLLRQLHETFIQPDLFIFIHPSRELVRSRIQLDPAREIDQFEGDPRELDAYEDYATALAAAPAFAGRVLQIRTDLYREDVFSQVAFSPLFLSHVERLATASVGG